VNLAPYGVFAKLAFPPCSRVEKPTYATVQMGKNQHLNLNSDLIYINHSCDPSLVSLEVFFLLWDLRVAGGGKGMLPHLPKQDNPFSLTTPRLEAFNS
jgi:hypothetical protein